MNSIHVLDTQVANGIAAGEVVERPASVVKELIENSLDAGAENILCEIRGGGIVSILIRDDGKGMNPQDAELAFLRHATSKIRTLEDLEEIHTMGFRGEALASIAAVSKVTLRTRERGSEHGYEILYEGGNLIHRGPCACAEGTSIEIRELFYNTPARYKFLKSDSAEASQISELLIRLMLARPDVSFRLIRDGKELLQSPGNNDLSSAIYTVMGRELSESMIYFQFDFAPLKLSGCISKPEAARKSRTRQIVLVNRRAVRSPLIKTAIDEATKSFFVKSTYPALVLMIEVPPNLIDVNVHPQKSEVRFWDEQLLYRAIFHSLKQALSETISVYNLAERGEVRAEVTESGTESKKSADLPYRFPEQEKRESEQVDLFGQERDNPYRNQTLQTESVQGQSEQRGQVYERIDEHKITKPFADLPVKSNGDYQADHESLNMPATLELPCRHPEIESLLRAKFLGQLFGTYILFEDGNDFILIDQHAAHERILYEALMNAEHDSEDRSIPSQPLLQPMFCDLSPAEMQLAEDHRQSLESMGFEFEAFSEHSMLIRSCPLNDPQKNMDPVQGFSALLEYIRKHQKPGLNHELREEAVAGMACKAAIKGHDRLSYEEIHELLQRMLLLEHPYQCPHGRPAVLRITQAEVEKWFKRSL